MSVAVATATGVEPDAHTRLLESAVAKNTRRLVPILGLAYLFNYLDRTSVGFAALQMNQAIGLTAAQFGWGAGILFFSYCLLEVPSNVLSIDEPKPGTARHRAHTGAKARDRTPPGQWGTPSLPSSIDRPWNAEPDRHRLDPKNRTGAGRRITEGYTLRKPMGGSGAAS